MFQEFCPICNFSMKKDKYINMFDCTNPNKDHYYFFYRDILNNNVIEEYLFLSKKSYIQTNHINKLSFFIPDRSLSQKLSITYILRFNLSHLLKYKKLLALI